MNWVRVVVPDSKVPLLMPKLLNNSRSPDFILSSLLPKIRKYSS